MRHWINWLVLCGLLAVITACGGSGGGSAPIILPPPPPPPPVVMGAQKSADAILTGYNLTPVVESFATGSAVLSVFDVSGHLSGELRVAAIDPVAVTIQSSGTAIVNLIIDSNDPALWRVPASTILSAPELQAYLNGDLEIRVSTTSNPGGEIAGRVLPDGVALLADNGLIADRSPRDEIIYFVMTDRFFNGDPSNDDGGPPGTISSGGFNPASTAEWHGGDFVGLSSKLDYLQGLGISTIWVTPPVANRAIQAGSNGYHGYWGVDFENVDPHLGTNDEYRAFIDAAHARGIKVYQDIVVNHTADVITYAENQFSYRPLSEPAYTPVVPAEFIDAKNPAWLNDPQYYHNRGNTTFSGGEDSIYGDFVGLDDVATELPFVRQQMIDIYQGWVEDFDVDGFRLDTAPHVKIDFWAEFAPALVDFAATLGKDNLTLYGEVFNGNPEYIAEFITRGKLPSALNFPLHFRIPGSFSGAGTRDLMQLFESDDHFIDADTDARDLVNFFGNHDIGRSGQLMRQSLPGLDDDTMVQAQGLAHALTFFLRGIPTIYYGDEQGFVSDGGDQGAREDMMPSHVASYNDNDLIGSDATTADDNFDPSHPLYRTFSRYSEIYRQHATLRRGIQLERYSIAGAGLYVVSRVIPEQRMEYLVAFNTSASANTVTVATHTNDANWYAVWPAAAAPIQSGGDGTLQVSVPAYDYVIYRSDSAMSEAGPVLSLAFPNLPDGARVDGLVEVLTDLTTTDFVRVWFETSIDGGPFVYAGEDFAAPYRFFWDSSAVAGTGQVTIRANVDNPAGDTVTAVVDLLVDNRVLSELAVHYENGNDRSELVAIGGGGEFVGPFPVSGSNTVLVDPAVALDSLTLIYQDRDQDEFRFDHPVHIHQAMLDSLTSDDGNGNLVINLYINNDRLVSGTSNFTGSGNPATLPFDPAAEAPFGTTTLFLRGSFNDWSLDHPLGYVGNYTYRGALDLNPGDYFYKIADADWSAATDFGGPYRDTGMSVGPGTANLQDEIQTSINDFYFFSIPDGVDSRLNFHQLITPNAADNPYGTPVFLRGSFNDWGLSAPMSYDSSTGTLEAILALDPASHQLKIASEDWATADFGSDGLDPELALGTPKTLVRSSNNLVLIIDQSGDFSFIVDTSSPESPVLTVIPAP